MNYTSCFISIASITLSLTQISCNHNYQRDEIIPKNTTTTLGNTKRVLELANYAGERAIDSIIPTEEGVLLIGTSGKNRPPLFVLKDNGTVYFDGNYDRKTCLANCGLDGHLDMISIKPKSIVELMKLEFRNNDQRYQQEYEDLIERAYDGLQRMRVEQTTQSQLRFRYCGTCANMPL